MAFQSSNFKDRNFLKLLDNEGLPITPIYTKDGAWLKHIGHSNTFCTRATRTITNHTLIGEYCLYFFPKEPFEYPCDAYPIKSRNHILHYCRKYNKY